MACVPLLTALALDRHRWFALCLSKVVPQESLRRSAVRIYYPGSGGRSTVPKVLPADRKATRKLRDPIVGLSEAAGPPRERLLTPGA